MGEIVMELKNITKTFPGVTALNNVSFVLEKGQIHALMGENGAGKSTFIKVITGVHKADAGEILLDGRPITFSNPNEAKAKGIAAIYQHATNYPDLNVTENIFMGHEKISPKTKRILWKEMHDEAKGILRSLGSAINPKQEMGTLSVAQQQIVEIAKAISTNARIIIMDEPTAALTTRESEELYRIAEKLRDQGTAIIFISHRFEDMYRLASKVTVLRDANYIGCWAVDDITNKNLIIAMVGREINQIFPKKEHTIGEEVFRVENLRKIGYFADISFSLHKGEILGLTGLVGAGRTELCETLAGIEKYDNGFIYLHGQKEKFKNPKDAMQKGVGYLPEDRQKSGLILQWGIGRNITLPTLENYSTKGWLNEKRESLKAKEIAEKLHVKALSVFDLVSSLSGGNQQKISVAKLLTTDLDVIILDEPTKGVDIGAKAAIYKIINELANEGYSVILVSSEMPEVIGLSDRVAVMREGRLVKIIDAHEVSQESILAAAMGEVQPGGEDVCQPI
ncbi:D-ribose transporter ATP-binding protein [Lysinibacillus contaminans]|uniref:D-ribose transporter ATP-binding protein n=2 Tax=Lysinibacillus contaminans TaxID=1293441 RepID=A0ABR5JYU0_9BACI|nr:D-ribose transporter ATP-binding protein [Lysinibacillus contaminans]